MRVLLTDYAWPDLTVEEGLLRPAGGTLLVAPSGDEETLAGMASQADAILTCWAPVTSRVIDACPNCRLVGRLGVGLDNIDVAHCTRRGIPVTNVPDYCVDEVAEHALALLLSLARNISFFHLRSKQGAYSLGAARGMRRIAGQTLGICGFGRIGQGLARKVGGLGLSILVYDEAVYRGGLPVQQVPLDVLLESSDMISIHLPLTEKTRGIFGTRALSKMKPQALLVNTARGPLVDREALAAALASGRLAGVGLDVHDPEPPDLASPLYRDERMIATPHAAFTSFESLLDLRAKAIGAVLDRFAGRRPANVVNPEVFESGPSR